MQTTEMELHTMARGVGGSYTKWQGKPPAHAIIMANHGDDTWTTVKVYDLTERIVYNDKVRIENGGKGPKDIKFKHDIDFENISEEKQEQIKEYAIAEFRDEGGNGDGKEDGEEQK
jgi:hypothetical protein